MRLRAPAASPLLRAVLPLLLVVLGACPLPVSSNGAACVVDQDCTQGLACVANVCGGTLPGVASSSSTASTGTVSSASGSTMQVSSSRAPGSSDGASSTSLTGSSSMGTASSGAMVTSSSAEVVRSSSQTPPPSSGVVVSSSRIAVSSSGGSSSAAPSSASSMGSASSRPGASSSSGVVAISSTSLPPAAVLDNLVAWYKGDNVLLRTGTMDVGTWLDAAPGDPNFLEVQADATVTPTLLPMVANGHNAVRFSGTSYLFATQPLGGGSGITIFLVIRGPKPRSAVRIQDSANAYIQFPSDAPWNFKVSVDQFNAGQSTGLGVDDNQWHVAVGSYGIDSSGTFDTWLDGALLASRASVPNNTQLPQATLTVGAYVPGANVQEFTVADIAEILIYNVQLTTPQLMETQAYLRERFGFQ